MTKIIKAKKKLCRKYSVNLWDSNSTGKTFAKRNYRPGQHGTLPRRMTNYGLHLLAKQKIRTHYNMLEKQFKNLFNKVSKMKGDRAENFAGALESRLCTVVYRANFAKTIFAAKQLVSHKHILVNGKSVNIGSYQVKPGDIISIRDKSKKLASILESIDMKEKDVPDYLELSNDKMSVKFLRVPTISEIPYAFEASYNLVVELYSR